MKKINSYKTLKYFNKSLANLICEDIQETDNEDSESSDEDFL